MFKLMFKKIITILHSKVKFILTCDFQSFGCIGMIFYKLNLTSWLKSCIFRVLVVLV